MLKQIFLCLTILSLSPSLFACSPSENFDIYFPRNSAEVPASEVLRFANWVADQKVTYRDHVTKESTMVGGHAEESEREPNTLAMKRLDAGMSLLKKFAFLRGDVATSTRTYSPRDVKNGKRVEISFEPDCPNKCCDRN
jgi:hypothetical protein